MGGWGMVICRCHMSPPTPIFSTYSIVICLVLLWSIYYVVFLSTQLPSVLELSVLPLTKILWIFSVKAMPNQTVKTTVCCILFYPTIYSPAPVPG